MIKMPNVQETQETPVNIHILNLPEFQGILALIENRFPEAVKRGETKEYGGILGPEWNTKGFSYASRKNGRLSYEVFVLNDPEQEVTLRHELNHVREWKGAKDTK